MISNHYTNTTDFIINLELTTKAPLHIGSGKTEKGSDEPKSIITTLIHGKETPYIPGSTLKGVIRSELERMIRSSNDELYACDLFSSDNCGDRLKKHVKAREKKDITKLSHEELKKYLTLRKTKDEQGLCATCILFGSKVTRATLQITEAYPKDPTIPILEKCSVAITRNNGTVSKNGPFFVEYIPPDVTFTFSIKLQNANDFKKGLLASIIRSFNLGITKLGAFTTKGFGEVNLKIISTIERNLQTHEVHTEIYDKTKTTNDFISKYLTSFIKSPVPNTL